MTAEEKILEKAELVAEWLRQGVTEKDIAGLLQIGESTFRKAKKENKKICNLIAEGKKAYRESCAELKKEQTTAVQQSLYKRCTGYDVELPKHYKVKRQRIGKDGEPIFDNSGKPVFDEQLEQVVEKQHIPADVTAIKFFLMNQDSKTWQSDPERLSLEKKRVANDTRRTKLAEDAAQTSSGQSLEDLLAEVDEDV